MADSNKTVGARVEAELAVLGDDIASRSGIAVRIMPARLYKTSSQTNLKHSMR